jgi:hypothetical protein
MSCYICLEEGGEQVNGCACRGSVAVHRPCLLEWLKTADNPFRCSVCKSDFSGPFLGAFLSAEQILFHPTSEEGEEEEEGEMWEFHGIPVFESEDQLVFASPEHMSIYFQTLKREFRSLKTESRRRMAAPKERRCLARRGSHAVLARGNRSFRK